MRTVDLLLKDALEGTLDGQRMSTCKQKGAGMEEEGVAKDLNDSSPTKSGESPTPGSPLEGVGVEEEDNEVFVLGVDSNVYRKSLMDLGQTSNVRKGWPWPCVGWMHEGQSVMVACAVC